MDRNEIYGDGVNIAARLESLADPGGICISEAVRDAVGTQLAFSYEFMGEQTVKNISKPVRAYRVVLEPVNQPNKTAPIGRRRQQHQLKVMLQTCVESKHGQVIYLRGAAGIGKTWLLETLQTLAHAQNFSCHIVQALGFGNGKDQDVIRALVRSLLQLRPDSDNEQTWTAARQALQAELLTSDQQVFLNDLLDLPQPTEWHPIYEAMDSDTRQQGKQTLLCHLVSRLSQQQPLLLAVEDIHWVNAAYPRLSGQPSQHCQ